MLSLQATHVHATAWRSFVGARRESWVDTALTRASRRLQKKTATAAPLALTLVDRRGIKKDRGGCASGKSSSPGTRASRAVLSQVGQGEGLISRRRFCG